MRKRRFQKFFKKPYRKSYPSFKYKKRRRATTITSLHYHKLTEIIRPAVENQGNLAGTIVVRINGNGYMTNSAPLVRVNRFRQAELFAIYRQFRLKNITVTISRATNDEIPIYVATSPHYIAHNQIPTRIASLASVKMYTKEQVIYKRVAFENLTKDVFPNWMTTD